MNVASLELSKTLFELSGWYDTFAWYSGDAVEFEGEAGYEGYVYENTMQYDWCTDTPAYDAGYLLRKLPKTQDMAELTLRIHAWEHNKWVASYIEFYKCTADTPEDALCRLAVELWKQGVLTKSQEETSENN